MGNAPGPARRDRALDQVLRIIEGVGVVDTAETGARTGLVAALDAVLGHVLAATDVIVLLVTNQVGGGLLVNGNVLEDVGGKGLGLDIDVPAGQASGEAARLCPLRPLPASPSSSPVSAKSWRTSSRSIPTGWPTAFWAWAMC